MLSDFELNQIKARSNDPDVATLLNEVRRMQQYLRDYNDGVEKRLNGLEEDLQRFEDENNRLLTVKEATMIERDACIGLIAQLARANGMKVGSAPDNTVVVDLPSGQVSWQYRESEAHLFETLPAYEGPVEELPVEEKYWRVMNPGLSE